MSCVFSEPGNRVLELGCGTWRLPATLQGYGLDVVGCDVWSDEYLAAQRAMAHANGLLLEKYDGITLPFPDEYFDVVTSHAVFEHIIDAEHMLNEITRVLRPQGRIVIVAPHCASPSIPFRAIVAYVHGNRWWRYETLGDIVTGLWRSVYLPIFLRFTPNARFVYIVPRMKNGEIDFQTSDDDAVHLNCPMSFRRWFHLHGYRFVQYNAYGRSRGAKLFNTVFPSFATTIMIVAEKQPGR